MRNPNHRRPRIDWLGDLAVLVENPLSAS